MTFWDKDEGRGCRTEVKVLLVQKGKLVLCVPPSLAREVGTEGSWVVSRVLFDPRII